MAHITQKHKYLSAFTTVSGLREKTLKRQTFPKDPRPEATKVSEPVPELNNAGL